MTESDLRVLCLSTCDEVPFNYFWKGPVDDPDEKNIGVPKDPTVDQVKQRLVEKGCKDPIVMKTVAKKNTVVFAWVDFANIDNVSSSVIRIEEVVSFTKEKTASDDFVIQKKYLNARLHAITHAFESLKLLREELKTRKVEVADKLMEDLEEASEKYNDDKGDYIEKISEAGSKEDLDEVKRMAEKVVNAVHRFLKQMIPDPVPFPDPDPDPVPGPRVQELEKQVISLTQAVTTLTAERDELKKTVVSLEEKVAELERKIGGKRVPKDPDVVDKTYVFSHPPNVDDDHIYLMRTKDHPFAFFYLKKDFLDKEKDKLDLKKDITCLIKTIERHCSSQSEPELTEEYRVRLGEDFFLCTGVLSQ